MWFNSWEFLIFLPIVLFLYYAFNHRIQNAWLLTASYVFYGMWDWRFLFLILASTLVDYFASLYIFNYASTPIKRKFGLYLSLLVNLGALGIFKYFNFFLDNFIALGGIIGLNLDTPVMRLLPPAGISFYTFQTLSYTIDVYFNKQKPEKSLVDFALYVSYFPQLVAGPIERASRLLPQITNKRYVNYNMIRSGLTLILIGFFKKIALADYAADIVETAFSNPGESRSVLLLNGLYMFSLQVYCDFSGYSNIARGVSKLFGIELMENFQTPYLARNIADFWRRWHISLSTWFRDYLFLPIAYSSTRKMSQKKYFGIRSDKIVYSFAISVTFLLCGFWHGAAWTFVIWGGLHGIYLIAYKLWFEKGLRLPSKVSLKISPRIKDFVFILITFHLVSISWIFFRSPNISTAWEYLTRLLSFIRPFNPIILLTPLVLFALLFPIDYTQSRKNDLLQISSWKVIHKAVYYLIIILSIIIFSGNEIPFIYFQF